MIKLAEEQGIEARRVGGFTKEELNYYDDGHSLVEAWNPGFSKWVLYDLSTNSFFWKDQVPLSFIEFSRLVDSGDYEIKPLAKDSTFDVSAFTAEGYDFAFFSEVLFANENMQREWYRRVIQIPFQGNYFFDIDAQDRMEAYGFTYMDEISFLKTFYGTVR